MLIGNHPGPWNLYASRPDNIGLPILEVKRKYLNEQLQYEQTLMIHIMNSQGAGTDASEVNETPWVELTTENNLPLTTEDNNYIII